MKNDIALSVIASIIGAVIAYIVTNLFIGPIPDFSYKTIDENIGSQVAEPSEEIFNYKAINPTVEVYVGDCDERDEFGECIENRTENGEE